ncbi:Ribonuclease Y [Clostridiales bacterium CHKCI001]|nr:Ribonuclease Y [Clostridiales bacterium CHKCI001]
MSMEKSTSKIIIALITGVCSIVAGYFGGKEHTEKELEQQMNLAAKEMNITISSDKNIEDTFIKIFDNYRELDSQYSSLENNYDSLKEKNDELTSNYSSLKKQYSDLEQENTSLKEQQSTLEEELKNLKESSANTNEQPSDDTPQNPNSSGVQLTTLTPVNKSYWSINEGGLEDSLEMDYSEAKSYIVTQYSGYGEYYINKQYKTLTGTIAAHSDMGERATSSVSIYGDDALIQTFSSINRKTERFSFSVDISSAKFLKIVVQQEGGYGQNNSVLLTDFTLN